MVALSQPDGFPVSLQRRRKKGDAINAFEAQNVTPDVSGASQSVPHPCHGMAKQYAGIKIQAMAVQRRAFNRQTSSAESDGPDTLFHGDARRGV